MMVMDCCNSSEDNVALYGYQKLINKQIEKDIQECKIKFRNEKKLLLLGSGDAGKSTFIKQMRIIHGEGFSKEEKNGWRKIIFSNVFDSILALIEAVETLNLQYEKPATLVKANTIRLANVEDVEEIEPMYVEVIKDVWNDSGIQACYARRNEFQLIDSAKYYLNDIDRISSSDYFPTEQDILRARVTTTGVIEYKFNISTKHLRIIDVGGQRSQRRKWLHYFADITALLFLTALSEYDQKLCEDHAENRMHDSRNIFGMILQYPFFQSTSFILFLNKVDLFEEKILTSDIQNYFPKYKGPKKNAEKGKEFIRKMFLKMNKNPDRTIYYHYTCATDTENIKVVFYAVKDIIMFRNLQSSSLLIT